MDKKRGFAAIDVFTPTKPAKITFVERNALENKLIPSLNTPGKQIVIYGHSGSGKTTLLVNKLRQKNQRFITTRCLSGMTFDQLILDAFDQLGTFYTTEKINELGGKLNAAIKAEYAILKAEIGSELSQNSEIKTQRILPPQLTPQTLAKLLGTANHWWILEDFHKISGQEKVKLTQIMKIFMDMSNDFGDLKIIAVGAVDTARQIIEFNPEMKNRVSEIKVPMMSHSEMKTIIRIGQAVLNFHIPSKVQTGIVYYSNGLAAVCHQLCLNLCFAANIQYTLTDAITIDDKQLTKAIEMYMENASDTLKSIFDKAFRQKKRKYDNGMLILGALSRLPQDGATYASILVEIRKKEVNYPPGNLTLYLSKLQTDDYGAAIRYDSASGKYSFSDPIYLAYTTLMFRSGNKITRGYPTRKAFDNIYAELFARITLEIVKTILLK